jgi:hypothetical protein
MHKAEHAWRTNRNIQPHVPGTRPEDANDSTLRTVCVIGYATKVLNPGGQGKNHAAGGSGEASYVGWELTRGLSYNRVHRIGCRRDR